MCWIELRFGSFTIYVYKYLRGCLASWKDAGFAGAARWGAVAFSLSGRTSLMTLALSLHLSEPYLPWQGWHPSPHTGIRVIPVKRLACPDDMAGAGRSSCKITHLSLWFLSPEPSAGETSVIVGFGFSIP